jgi:hypothetical protein
MSSTPAPQRPNTPTLPLLGGCRQPGAADGIECEAAFTLRLRKELNMPMEAMLQARDLFRRHADNAIESNRCLQEGILRKPGFVKVWSEMTHHVAGDEVAAPLEIWKEALRHAGQGTIKSGLDFGQFATWFSSRYFCEDVSLDEPRRRLRSVARQFSMHPDDVDTYNQKFTRFDTDGNGTIDRQEFEKLLYQCTKVPEEFGLPAARIEHFWQCADEDGSQQIEFDEFLKFYTTYLGTDSTGFEDFYRPKGRHSVPA